MRIDIAQQAERLMPRRAIQTNWMKNEEGSPFLTFETFYGTLGVKLLPQFSILPGRRSAAGRSRSRIAVGSKQRICLGAGVLLFLCEGRMRC